MLLPLSTDGRCRSKSGTGWYRAVESIPQRGFVPSRGEMRSLTSEGVLSPAILCGVRTASTPQSNRAYCRLRGYGLPLKGKARSTMLLRGLRYGLLACVEEVIMDESRRIVRLAASDSRRRAVEKEGFRVSYTSREAGKVWLVMVKKGA